MLKGFYLCYECGIMQVKTKFLCKKCYMEKWSNKLQSKIQKVRCACKPDCPKFIYPIDRSGQPRKYALGHGLLGERHHHWKGGIRKHTEGYNLKYVPDHKYADSHGAVMEHRWVLEQYYSQKFGIPIYIFPYLEVHHKNGKKRDNRPENLELIDPRKHRSITNKKDMSKRRCSVCGSKKTYIEKRTGYSSWRLSKDKEFVCRSCSYKPENQYLFIISQPQICA